MSEEKRRRDDSPLRDLGLVWLFFLGFGKNNDEDMIHVVKLFILERMAISWVDVYTAGLGDVGSGYSLLWLPRMRESCILDELVSAI